jgi:transcription-repair coupling factor (superfamily II helicase)
MFFTQIQTLTPQLKPGSRTAVGPFYGSGDALFIAELLAEHPLVTVVTPSSQSAHQLERELLLFAPKSTEVLVIPDWETLPYDNFSPHPDITSERLKAFYHIPRMQRGVIIVPVTTLMQRTPPPHYVDGNTLLLAVGDAFDTESFVNNLVLNGYRSVDTVYEHGEFTVRGSLVDIFPMGSTVPYRIDLFDNEIETLRIFDPETQRTIEKVEGIELLPAREFPLHRDAIARFQLNWYRTFDGDADACPLFHEISQGRVPAGGEYFLPLFFDACGTVFDYLTQGSVIVTLGDHHGAAQRFWREIKTRYDDYGIDPRRPLLAPATAFVPVEEVYAELQRFAAVELRTNEAASVHISTALSPPPNLLTESAQQTSIQRLQAFMQRHKGPVLLCAESEGRKEILLDTLKKHDLRPVTVTDWADFIAQAIPFGVVIAPVDRGLYWHSEQPTLLTENQLFGERVAQRRRRKKGETTDSEAIIKDLTELRPGVPVVHIEHGVGRYIGLQTLDIDGSQAEFLLLEYAANDKLYVPVSSLHLISRYTGADPEQAPLHRLGSEQWDKARKKASQRASDVAAQLLEVYARREAREGFQCELDEDAWEQFCEGFPFEETPDQLAAIEAVRQDMCSVRVMDRLICGDVGFGKTEVAMRAAFIAAHNHKQVAILVPTTLLAQQHYASFRDRFAHWPITIEVISRFKTGKDLAAVSKRVANGDIDILVGTHKLLQSDFKFNDLGLLIIDEEHRFGVKQKEAIKALRAEVDILTMTATPIPRTLNMALGGLRDLSVIATPPARRLSIKTFVREHSIALVKEAVLRETLRGGQVYYLHNEVKSIEESARKLRELLPELSIGVAHGQLREQEIEKIMSDFYHQRHHILVCSTIIETGIDVPNANTIIIERADKFGLAQLHQLRGRVGRSHHQAYAYLLCPPRSNLTKDAEKRLEAIEAAGELGAGYMLATHDLEIRGAGELLGDEQSGQISSVGFSLYLDMLQSAVRSLKRGEIPDIDAPIDRGTEIKLHETALIPEDYLPDIATRLVLYKRIAAAQDEQQLRDIQVEMIDRFGLLPDAVKTLFLQATVKLKAAALGIAKIDISAAGGTLEFTDKTTVDPLALIKLIQSAPTCYSLSGSHKLKVATTLPTLDARVDFLDDLFARWSATPDRP